MSDEALDAHLQWLDDCARAQVVDYETWLEGRVALLEAENAALSELLSPLVDVELERDIAMSENQRLTKHVEDYEAENAELKQINGLLRTRLAYYGRVLTKEANRKDVLPTSEEQTDE